MFDVINKREWTHGFDEIFEIGSDGVSYDENFREGWKRIWDYLNEAKSAEELWQFICSSELNPIGRRALELRDKYGISRRYNLRNEYKNLRHGECTLMKLENGKPINELKR